MALCKISTNVFLKLGNNIIYKHNTILLVLFCFWLVSGSLQQHSEDSHWGHGCSVWWHAVSAHQLLRWGLGTAHAFQCSHCSQHSDHPSGREWNSQGPVLCVLTQSIPFSQLLVSVQTILAVSVQTMLASCLSPDYAGFLSQSRLYRLSQSRLCRLLVSVQTI